MSVFQWKCINCGVTAKVRLWPVRCSCGFIDYGSDYNRNVLINYGPGTELMKIIHELFPNIQTCGSCLSYANMMNKWGVDECKKRIPVIVDRLKEQMHNLSNTDILFAAVKSLKITFPSLLNPLNAVEEAIKLIVQEAISRSERQIRVRPQFIKTSDMVKDVYSVIGNIPHDVDVVVGVARSGMLPASIIATNLHIPLFSCDLKNNRVLPCGYGYRSSNLEIEPKHILIVEDTIMNGFSIKKATDIVRNHFASSKISDFVVYVNPEQPYVPTVLASFLNPPHLLEWNFFNSYYISISAVDFDGILCYEGRDTKRGPYNIDERPLYVPRFTKVPLIVTGRPSCMREESESWLAKHKIQYGKLVMWEGSMDDWYNTSMISKFKADVYSRMENLKFFVESCPIQARDIHQLSGKVTVCPTTGDVFGSYDNPT